MTKEDEESFPMPDGYYAKDGGVATGVAASDGDGEQELSRRLRGYRKQVMRTYSSTWRGRLPTVLMYCMYLFV